MLACRLVVGDFTRLTHCVLLRLIPAFFAVFVVKLTPFI